MRIVDPRCEPAWDSLVASHPQCTIFHSAAWARVLCKTYGHSPTYAHLARDGRTLALIPLMEVASPFTGRRGVSLPFSDFCSPLVFEQLEGATLMEQLMELGLQRKWRYFELRGGRDALPFEAAVCNKFHGHKLDLTLGAEELFARFDSSVRRAIRKAEKSVIVIEAGKSWASMLEFYHLHSRTRRRHGLPPQPLGFFRNIHREIIGAGLGFVVLAKIALRPVAAAVFFHFGKRALYKFGASNERMQEFRGNNLVLWEGIKNLAAAGFDTLQLGRTDPGEEGLRRFKLAWGTEEDKIEYFRFAPRTQTWEAHSRSSMGFHNELFRRLPLMVNQLTGTLIYPHLD